MDFFQCVPCKIGGGTFGRSFSAAKAPKTLRNDKISFVLSFAIAVAKAPQKIWAILPKFWKKFVNKNAVKVVLGGFGAFLSEKHG